MPCMKPVKLRLAVGVRTVGPAPSSTPSIHPDVLIATAFRQCVFSPSPSDLGIYIQQACEERLSIMARLRPSNGGTPLDLDWNRQRRSTPTSRILHHKAPDVHLELRFGGLGYP